MCLWPVNNWFEKQWPRTKKGQDEKDVKLDQVAKPPAMNIFDKINNDKFAIATFLFLMLHNFINNSRP